MADRHGNQTAREGCSRCECGCKYWEHDRCVDCGTQHDAYQHDDIDTLTAREDEYFARLAEIDSGSHLETSSMVQWT